MNDPAERLLAFHTFRQNVQDLTSFARDVRQATQVAEEPTMLSEALRTVAGFATSTAQRLEAMDPTDPKLETLEPDDMMILIMLAGYTSGRTGITLATDTITKALDLTETEGAEGGDSDR